MSEMITLDGVTKRYGGLVAINNVTLGVHAGEIVGFLGLNGAGKSTTMRILAGAISPDLGRVSIDGLDLKKNERAVKRRVGYLPEIPPVYGELTVREYLRFVGRLKGVSRRALGEQVARVVSRFSLEEVSLRLIGHLSKGFRQRVGFAQALLGEPPVLILDEPTAGLDPQQIGAVRALIKELAGAHTVILSTHILQEVSAVCSRAVIIHRGQIVSDDILGEATDGTTLERKFLSLTDQSASPDAPIH